MSTLKAVVTKGKHKGTYTGIVAIRANGYFNIKDVHEKILAQGIKYLNLLQHADGFYAYAA